MVHTSDFPPRLDRVRGAIDAFYSLLSPEIPRPEIVRLGDRAWCDADWRAYRKQARVQEAIGVYLHFDEQDALLYIGMTLSGFDRCWAADTAERRWIDGIKMDPAYDFLVPALELFLIRRLLPRNNRMHGLGPPTDGATAK